MVQPGSSKHSPRVDDELDEEVASLTHGAPDEGRTERRRQQAPAEGEPETGAHRPDPADPTRDIDLVEREAKG